MKLPRWLVAMLLVAMVLPIGCKKKKGSQKPAARAKSAAGAPAPSGTAAAPEEIPVTTSSAQARAAFRAGRDLQENARAAEAIAKYRQALKLDPNFSLALAATAGLTPGAEADGMLRKALKLSKKLPRAERLLVEMTAAQRNGENKKAQALRLELVKLVPTDWRIHQQLGGQYTFQRRYADAVRHLRRAAALNPKAGVPYNLMGYALAFQGKHDEAIAAIKKYVAYKPREANPLDSMGELLLRAGRYAQAEAAFKKSAALAPRFHIPLVGVAISRFYRRDWKGGRRALRQARKAATQPGAKVNVLNQIARSYEAEGRPDKALATLRKAEAEAKQRKLAGPWVYSAMNRSRTLFNQGKYPEAVRAAELTFARARTAKLSKGSRRFLRFWGNLHLAKAKAMAGDTAGARQALGVMEKRVRALSANSFLASAINVPRGILARVKGGEKAALPFFQRCVKGDSYCRWQLARTLEKLGKKKKAARVRKQLRGAQHRDMSHLYVWSRLPGEA